MTYRCRGGFNGRGGIIRGPPRKPLFQSEAEYNEFMQNSHVGGDIHTIDRIVTHVEQPHVLPQSSSGTYSDASPAVTSAAVTPNNVITSSTNIVISSNTAQTSANTAATANNLASGASLTATTTSSVTPTDHTSMVITDETGNPAKVNAVLNPDGDLWFTKRAVVKKVTGTSYKQFFDKPYNNWAMVPENVRHHWWLSFRKEFSWDPSIAKLVKDKWRSKLKRRLTDVVSKLVNQHDYRPKWCPQSLIADLKKVRDTPEFKKKSEQCSTNKKNSHKGLSKHSQGSVSAEELKDKMTLENGGVKPKPHEVYKRGHIRKNGAFVDDRSQAFWNTLQQKQADNKESDEPKTEEQVYYEVAGGFDAKGRVYGIGSAVESYYEKPVASKKGPKAPSQHVINLENRVLQLTSENSQNQQALIDTRNQVELLQRQVELLTQQVTGCSNFSTPPRSPPPPPPPSAPTSLVS